ncbi:MAG: DUF814 domain-containing protein [Myxococcales bacterium]|nr:DUF814 domain-containing protein [Myxococcales bacterium]
MSLSAAELAAVVAELAPRLVGSTVGKVRDAAALTTLLEIGRESILLSVHPRASRLHLAPGRAARPAGERGAAPSGWAMLLRNRLGGLRLAGLAVTAPGERIVELTFGAGRERLVAELLGAVGNVLLIGPDGQIIATLRPVRGGSRRLAPGTAYSPPPPRATTAAPPARFADVAAVATHYEALLAADSLATLRAHARTRLTRELARTDRLLAALAADLRRADEAAPLRKLADLLLAHLSDAPPRGATSVTLPDDFEDGAPLTIPLRPELDAKANAARFYRTHKRLAGGRRRILARLEEIHAARARLARSLDETAALTADALTAREPTPAPVGRSAQLPVARLPYREFTSAAGDAIWVGRGAADNDSLTFRHASGHDVWLHARDVPGAHVVVRCGRRELAPDSLVDAATLAAHYSPLADEAQVDVGYTRVKHLRKPRGAAPGLVYVSDEKTLRVRLEPARLARLLAARDRRG